MFRNSPKIYFLKQIAQKANKRVKQQALQNGYLEFAKFRFSDPQIFNKKHFFRKKTIKTFFKNNFQKTGKYAMKTSIWYAHTKF